MADKTITSANSIYMLSINGVFNAPVQLQGFSADDVFDTEAVDRAEVQMGVDGHMSVGFVYMPIKQGISLMADSDSNDIFEGWDAANQGARNIFIAQGTVILSSLGKAYTLTRGALTSYPPMADAKKVLQPRKYGITWERVQPAVI